MSRQLIRSSALAAIATLCTTSAWAQLSAVTEDFESLDAGDTSALGASGWLVFGNVYDGVSGDFLFGYGPFPAPNDGAAFSAVVTGEGGADQGDQQLSVFSDYNNVDQHGAGNLVEANVFREQTVGAEDVGSTYTFTFDAKRGNIELGTTAIAFIKTLDPANGFALTNFLIVDTTAIADEWGTFSLSIAIDAGLENQLLQVGFSNTATNFEGSGIFYDNVDFSPQADDTDGDGVADASDNCLVDANADQRDTDGDGFGNACDGDFNNDCSTDFSDLGILRDEFFSVGDVDTDMDGDGNTNFIDLGLFREDFFVGPGPSGVPNICEGG